MGLFSRRKSATATAPRPAEAGAVATALAEAPEVADIAGQWTIDASHSRVGFSARHAMVTTVRGQFTEVEGTAHIDTANPSASHATVTIAAASIDTGQADRDGHLRSADFFDAETYPTLTFTTTEVTRTGPSTWALTGDLTIKDVTRPVTFELESAGTARDPFGNLRTGFEGGTSINRKDWGLTWNAALETGGVLVSEKIRLELDLSVIAVPVTV